MVSAKERMSASGRPLCIDIVTLFPEMFAPVIGLSIIGRAIEAGRLVIRLHNPLDALAGAARADDTPYGGGPGMVMRLEPIVRILDAIIAEHRVDVEDRVQRRSLAETASIDAVTAEDRIEAAAAEVQNEAIASEDRIAAVTIGNREYPADVTPADGAPSGGDPAFAGIRFILTSPAGRTFAQGDATLWAAGERIVIVCGHYEGIDDRLCALYPFEEMSIGDFILTGGEIPALAMLDAVARLREGVVSPESLVDESFTLTGLEYPAYTRPPRFRGIDVPAVLLSGDHAAIARWRREQSRERTRARRPDLS